MNEYKRNKTQQCEKQILYHHSYVKTKMLFHQHKIPHNKQSTNGKSGKRDCIYQSGFNDGKQYRDISYSAQDVKLSRTINQSASVKDSIAI